MPETFSEFATRVYGDTEQRVPTTFEEWVQFIDWTREHGGEHRLNSLNAIEHGAPHPMLAERARRYQEEIRAEEPVQPGGYSERVEYVGVEGTTSHWRLWPCGRRDAHGPHRPTVRMARGFGEQTIDCAGVKAHPETMSGSEEVADVWTCRGCPLSCGNCGR